MKALRRVSGRLSWADVERPQVRESTDVEVRVMCAGVCRTDLYMARGLMEGADPVVLGHEFSGVVTGVGHGVEKVKVGDHVAASPLVGCGECAPCVGGELPHRCLAPEMIGVDRDGGFAQVVVVPESVIYEIPNTLSFEKGAYVEPVAASLAVVDAGIGENEHGIIYGGGRIAELTRRVLGLRGGEGVPVFDPESGDRLEEASLDFVVETGASDESMREIMRALKPGGLLVLKSRPREAVRLDILEIVRKELRLVGAHYGSFEEAIELLVSGELEVKDLFGPTCDMADYARIFDSLWSDESRKVFLSPIWTRR